MLEKSAANTGKFSAAEHTTHATATLLPPPNCFIIFCVCSNCLIKRFTVAISTPAPFAIRCFLRGQDLGIPAFLFVMDNTMASVRFICVSSMAPSRSDALIPIPGSIPKMSTDRPYYASASCSPGNPQNRTYLSSCGRPYHGSSPHRYRCRLCLVNEG